MFSSHFVKKINLLIKKRSLKITKYSFQKKKKRILNHEIERNIHFKKRFQNLFFFSIFYNFFLFQTD